MGKHKKLKFMLQAFESGDFAFQFSESAQPWFHRRYNALLNRVRDFVAGKVRLCRDNEQFHREIEDMVPYGLLGLDAQGNVRCWNKALSEVMGLHSPKVLKEVERTLPGLGQKLSGMREGDTMDLPLASEKRIHYFVVRHKVLMEGDKPIRIFFFFEENRQVAADSEQEQWKKMTRIISHEVLNTLTPVVSLSDTLLGMTQDESLREGLSIIGNSSRGLLGFVNGYRALSRVPVPQIHPFRFTEFLNLLLHQIVTELEAMGGSVDVNLKDRDMVIFADEQLFRQVFTNILGNALTAVKERYQVLAPSQDQRQLKGKAGSSTFVPVIRIEALVNAFDNTEIRISNNGYPIPTENVERIFEPFFTTKSEGTGVGLALSRQIIRAHNGTLTLERSDPSWTIFKIVL